MNQFVEEFKDIESIAEEYGVGQDSPSDARSITRKQDILNELSGAEVLLAWYGYGDYSGESFVLYRKNGLLYEVNGSHCSCYGLEGQWEPEETTWDALTKREFGSDTAGHSEARKIMNQLLLEQGG